MKYKLEGKTPVPCDDVLEWARWFETADRQVAKDEIHGIRISTVFLGLNHGYAPGEMLLFETMIFRGALNGACWRCETWEQAEAQHSEAVALVEKSIKD